MNFSNESYVRRSRNLAARRCGPLSCRSESRTSRHGILLGILRTGLSGSGCRVPWSPELLDDEADNSIKQLEASTHNVDSNAIIQSLNLLYTNSY
jgi:hypothetical protein